MPKLFDFQLVVMARLVLQAKKDGDPRYRAFCETLAKRSGLSYATIERKVREYAEMKPFKGEDR